MATLHLPIQIWLFLFIPQGKLPPNKNRRKVKNFHFQLNLLHFPGELLFLKILIAINPWPVNS